MPIAVAGLDSGKHVLLEKPMGRNLNEARLICNAAQRSNRLVKVGFNHRYHPAIAAGHEVASTATLGRVLNARVVYGHGGRPGYENEWRGDADLAGGGEATDQGVHVFDLLHWYMGVPVEAFASLQTAFWPIAPLEDNVFGMLRYQNGGLASFHTSWTQWKNRFSFEVFCEQGSIAIEGLGRSYGAERLLITRRSLDGSPPNLSEQIFGSEDVSWDKEWNEFVGAILDGTDYMGGPADGIIAMRTLDAVYNSAQTGLPAPLKDDPF